MGFSYNATNIKPDAGGAVPRGIYDLEITDAIPGKTKESDRDKVTVHCKIVESLQYEGRSVKYHTVVFIPEGEKGAGMALHFLKTIGEPYEGNLEVNPDNWKGKRFRATLVIDEKGYNKITGVMPYEGPKTKSEEDVPF